MGKESVFNGNKPRILWLDFVRSLAILMVVVVHATENIYHFNIQGISELGNLQKVLAFCGFTFGRLGVPLFLFLTGYLLLARDYDSVDNVIKFWKRKLVPLLTTYACWTLIYELFQIIIYRSKFNFITCLKRLLFLENPSMSHMWYMPMIIGMYLTLPLLSIVLRKMPFKILIIPVLVCFFYSFITSDINVLFKHTRIGSLTPTLTLSYTGGVYGLYIVSGYLFRTNQKKTLTLSKRFRYFVTLTSIVSFVLLVLMQIYMYTFNNGYNVWYNSSLLYICALSLFTTLYLIKDSLPFPKLWCKISIFSMGIYYIHNIFLKICLNYNIGGINSWPSPFQVIVIFIVCFTMSILSCKLISLNSRLSRILLLMGRN